MNPKLNIKYWRKLKKVSQKTLSEPLKTTQGYLSEIESGIKTPTIQKLYDIANHLDVCPRLLLKCVIECNECNKEIKCMCEGE